MSRKKGLSLDEKRQRMMDFFYEKLKELEKMCYKEKGINAMSVKDVLMSLVHDGMVDTDKIGTCVYFWAFPNKATQKYKSTIDRLKAKIEDTDGRTTRTRLELSEAFATRQDTEERRAVIEELVKKQARLDSLTAELKALEKYDPERYENLKTEAQTAVDSANRWTDNVFVTRSWLCRKFSVEQATLDKQFAIPENFDYLEQ